MKTLENITIGYLLARTAACYPQRDAVICGGKIYSYASLDKEVDACAGSLLGLGIKRGMHVGLMCEIGIEDIVLIYALARIGAVSCLLNTCLKPSEIEALTASSDVECVIVGRGCANTSAEDLGKFLSEHSGGNISVYSLEDIKKSEPVSVAALEFAKNQVLPQDTAFIIYTSGTTSVSKAVMGSHFSRVNCSMIQARDLGAVKTDRFLAALPAFHCFCLSVNIFAACCVGGCVVVPKSRRTKDILECIKMYRCTLFSAVPTLFHAIISRPDIGGWDISSLRAGFIGGSYCSEELFCKIEEKLGITLLSSLGQTETTAGFTVTNFSDPQSVRANTLGKPMDNVELAFGDITTGKMLPQGRSGEILVKGYCLMQGYYNCPPLCKDQIDKDGWLHTGDVGCLDENDNLVLNGRIKELIIRSGENISPLDIEGVIAELPQISLSKAFGVPDDHYGEEICLAVVKNEGFDVTADEIREVIASKLARFKVPKYVVFMDSFPLTSTGKIKTGELQKLAVSRIFGQNSN